MPTTIRVSRTDPPDLDAAAALADGWEELTLPHATGRYGWVRPVPTPDGTTWLTRLRVCREDAGLVASAVSLGFEAPLRSTEFGPGRAEAAARLAAFLRRAADTLDGGG